MTNIDDELGALYRAARAQEAPSRADRDAVRRALTSALVVTATAASAHAAASSAAATHAVQALTVGKVATFLCIGAALGGVTSSAAWVLTASPEPTRSVVSVSTSAAARVAPRRSDPNPSAPRSVTQPAVLEEEPARELQAPISTSSAATRGRALSAEPAPAPAPSSLAAESEGLLAVQRALAQGDAPRALQLLGQQDAQFQGGALSEERAVARVLAWCAAGRPEQARVARARFFSTYPRSPHAQRVQNSCARE
jgi:hypothetical protein